MFEIQNLIRNFCIRIWSCPRLIKHAEIIRQKSTINYPFLAQSNVHTTVSTDGILFPRCFFPVCQWLISRCFWERIFSDCFTKSTSIRGVDFTWIVFTWEKPAFLPGLARLSYVYTLRLIGWFRILVNEI